MVPLGRVCRAQNTRPRSFLLLKWKVGGQRQIKAEGSEGLCVGTNPSLSSCGSSPELFGRQRNTVSVLREGGALPENPTVQ